MSASAFPHDESYDYDGFAGCTLEELKRDVDRGYRRFWRARGQRPPGDGGFREAVKASMEAEKARKVALGSGDDV